MNDRIRVWTAEDWLKFLAKCKPAPPRETRLYLTVEHSMIDAIQLRHRGAAMKAFTRGAKGLLRLGFITDRTFESWMQPCD